MYNNTAPMHPLKAKATKNKTKSSSNFDFRSLPSDTHHTRVYALPHSMCVCRARKRQFNPLISSLLGTLNKACNIEFYLVIIEAATSKHYQPKCPLFIVAYFFQPFVCHSYASDLRAQITTLTSRSLHLTLCMFHAVFLVLHVHKFIFCCCN